MIFRNNDGPIKEKRQNIAIRLKSRKRLTIST